jgi:inner membrane protein
VPTLITHALLPLIAAGVAGRGRISPRLMMAGIAAAVLPDADVIGFRLGIPYGAGLGHRGASHSLLFALICGLVAMMAAKRLRASRRTVFAFVALAAASHGLTDMLTNGGHGVALWWPLSGERLFWAVRPVEVSSIGIRALTDGSLVHVLASEILWLVLPTVLLALLFRRLTAPHIDLQRGQS